MNSNNNKSKKIYTIMVYHRATLNPTNGQLDDLSHGTEIKLSEEHLHGNCPFELTTSQVKKIMKAAASGKGCTLKLSAAQLKHHALHGEGRFSDMLRAGFKLLKPVLRAGLHKGMEYGRDYAESKIANATGLQGDGFLTDIAGGIEGLFGGEVKPRKQRGGSFLGDAGRWIGHHAVDGVVDVLGGDIKPKTVRRRKQAGRGWVGNLAKKAGHFIVDNGVDLLGGSVQPNQLANPNENLRAALFQKKVRGEGLYM